MVKEGYPFVVAMLLPALILAALAFLLGSVWLIPAAALFFALTLFMAYFFRDPERLIPDRPGVIVSAADGRVTRVEDRPEGKFVSVFLSPLDVHVNRAPIAGKIVSVEYIKGRKDPATSDNASLVNERNSITIEGDGMTVVCTQIAGIVARRIVCWAKNGDNLELGQRFGLIKFSSRTDLLMPLSVDVLVKPGDRVVGGETIIAQSK
jgi:phosphatidylserine decarboxylase